MGEIALAPCPTCGRMSTADHRRVCAKYPPAAPAPAPRLRAPKPPLHPDEPRIIERCSWDDLPIVVEVDHPVISPNRLMHEHYFGRAHRRLREAQATWKQLEPHRPPPLPGPDEPRILALFTRFGPILLDDDGLSYSFKSPRDQVSFWLGCGDSPRDPVVWKYAQELRREKLAPSAATTRNARAPKFRIWFRIEIRRAEALKGSE